jgi:hypothetical protein
MLEFKPWPKIKRYEGNWVAITEKIDGTNACIIIKGGVVIGCQSRNKLITPQDDNMGFANWVESNKEKLSTLGDGYHYGEWAGPGIQSNPHKLEKKTFFLFNVKRWSKENIPDVCEVVPVLYSGDLYPHTVAQVMADLALSAENLYIPEGVIIYYESTGSYNKVTFKNSEGKWKK